MGITGQMDSELFQEVMQSILKTCQELRKPAGLHIVQPDPHELNSKLQEGFQLLAYSIDAVFLNSTIQSPLQE